MHNSTIIMAGTVCYKEHPGMFDLAVMHLQRPVNMYWLAANIWQQVVPNT